MEYSTARNDSVPKQQHVHHFGEALCNHDLQKPGCTSRHPREECRIAQRIQSASHSTAITSEKCRMTAPCRNLGVSHTLIQRWDVALTISIQSTSNSTRITSEEQGESIFAGRNLGVCYTLSKGGMSHDPERSTPHAKAQPSLRRSIVQS